jgi:ribose transport system permease protein
MHPTSKAASTMMQPLVVLARRFSAVCLLVVFAVIFSFAAPSTFPTIATARLTLSGEVTVGILALAVLVPLCAGAFDLSVGAMLAFGMVVLFQLVAHHWNPLLAGLVSIICCAVAGMISGYVVVRLHVNSFIATLGMSQVLSAVMLFISKNTQLEPPFPNWFAGLTSHRFLGISCDFYYLLILAIIIWYVLELTPVGRLLFATGGNAEAARLAGIPTERYIWGSLIVSAAISGLGGVVLASQVGIFQTSFGIGDLFPAFAAVFFGATQIKGRPNVWGTLIALYALAVGVSGLQLTFFGSQFWITPLFDGVALLIAVIFASQQIRAKRRSGAIGRQIDDKGAVDASARGTTVA